jgi:DNA-binding SARP family transcriptional activator
MTNVPCDFMRAFHRALLLTCGARATHEFWVAHPLVVDGQTVDPVSIARHLAVEGERVPLAWACAAMNDLEWLLVERGMEIDRFLDAMTLHGNRGSFVSSRLMMATFSPLLALLFRLSDPHHMVLRMLALAGSRFFPELLFQELAFGRMQGERRAIVSFGFRSLWDGSCPPWDGDVFTARMLQKMPVSLGVQPYKTLNQLADARPVAQAVHRGMDVALSNGRVRVNGDVIGRMISFDGFCQSLGVQLSDPRWPKPQVALIERDYMCPVRGRVVLRASCAYGAPYYLFEAIWKPERARAPLMFQHFVKEVLDDLASDELTRAQQLEREFTGANLRCKFIIRTLGSFSVEGPRQWAAKSQLRLLKVLVATGGEVPLTRAAAELWPSRSASASRSAFDTAVHRLRQQLGDDTLVVLERGQIRLDQTRISIDLVDLREICAKIQARVAFAEESELRSLASELQAVYCGPFCDGDEDVSIVKHRERLARIFTTSTKLLMERARELGALEQASEWIETAISRDERNETLHRLCIETFVTRGCKAEAITAFQRYVGSLQGPARLTPSREIERLVRDLA